MDRRRADGLRERARDVRRKRHSARLLGAALATLLTGTLAGASGLVLCLGADGHRALELEHGGRDCPTVASEARASTGISLQSPAECLDLPTAGTGPMTPSSSDPDRVPEPPVTFLVASPEVAPKIESRLPGPTEVRTGPPDLAAHLRSTVLLV